MKSSILYIEDHDDTRIALARLLELDGFTVRTAATVAEARQQWCRQRPDLLLCDLGLPDGDACDLLNELRAEVSNGGAEAQFDSAERSGPSPLRAIALTAFGMEADRERAISAGFMEFIVKPAHMPQVLDAIARVMQRMPTTAIPSLANQSNMIR